MIDMTTILYCITGALIRVVKGDINNSLIFCGENAYKLNKIISLNFSSPAFIVFFGFPIICTAILPKSPKLINT